MGGEKLRVALWRLDTRGSPPHGRGKEFSSCHCCVKFRITPAWAGKRWCICTANTVNGDHPRMGGEKACHLISDRICVGSPPHGRGKVFQRDLPDLAAGITPAWAGKRRFRLVGVRCPGDHPRMGGEKTQNPIGGQFQQGSPPHGRGKAHCCDLCACPRRITPAWAGKSHRLDGSGAAV